VVAVVVVAVVVAAVVVVDAAVVVAAGAVAVDGLVVVFAPSRGGFGCRARVRPCEPVVCEGRRRVLAAGGRAVVSCVTVRDVVVGVEVVAALVGSAEVVSAPVVAAGIDVPV